MQMYNLSTYLFIYPFVYFLYLSNVSDILNHILVQGKFFENFSITVISYGDKNQFVAFA